MKTFRDDLAAYIKEKYGCGEEYPWIRYPNYAVFRHADNEKWFGLVMNIPVSKLGLRGDDNADILNVKLGDPLLADLLIKQEGYFRGYHISRGNWVSILLDGTVPFDDICRWLDESYICTASAKKKQQMRAPKEWVIPSNPKHYDIISAFEAESEIDWKQGKGIRKGDTVYIYVGSPVSAILYKCAVTETDIPYKYDNGKLRINSIMKIKLLKKYPPDKFTFAVLNDEYEIYAVRGPRGIPESLSAALNE